MALIEFWHKRHGLPGLARQRSDTVPTPSSMGKILGVTRTERNDPTTLPQAGGSETTMAVGQPGAARAGRGTSLWNSKFFRVGLLVCLALAAGEAVLRVRAHLRFGFVGTSYMVETPDGARVLQPNFTVSGSSGEIHINEHGFRGKSFEPVPPAGLIRIACLGSSVVFGGMTDEELIFPSRLQEMLNSDPAGPRVEVINAGVPGREAETVLWDFENRVVAYAPRVALVYAVVNDIGAAMREARGPAGEGPPKHFLQAWWHDESVLYNVAAGRLGRFHPNAVRGRFQLFPAGLADRFRQNYRAIVRSCKAHGVIPVLMTEAHAFRRDQPEQMQEHLLGGTSWGLGLEGSYQAHDSLNEAVRWVAAAEDTALIDMARRMPGGSRYFSDSIHFTVEGHRIAAQQLAQGLREQGVLQQAALLAGR